MGLLLFFKHIKKNMTSTYCVLNDGAGIGKIVPNKCPPPGGAGALLPFKYITGPKSSSAEAAPHCATTDATTGIQSFTVGACPGPDGPNSFTFYTYKAQLPGVPSLCLAPSPTGTVITTLPANPSACTMNLNVGFTNTTCADTGCGDHGSCVNGSCACTDYWSGAQCEVPPPSSGSPGCSGPTACGNQGVYGTCQSGKTSAGGVTGSGACQCDLVPEQLYGNNCEQTCIQGDATACGGPLRGVCVDPKFQFSVNSNAVLNRCACLNGWTGVNCNIPPPGWTCNATDRQCTNVTTMDPKDTLPTGTCNNGVCSCDNTLDCNAPPGSAGNVSFTGVACQTSSSTVGSPCKDSSTCQSGQTCVSNICSCGSTPEPSSNVISTIIQGIFSQLSTGQGFVTFAGQVLLNGLFHGVPGWSKAFVEKMVQSQFQKLVLARLTESAVGKTMGKDAVKFMFDNLGRRLATKVMAQMGARDLLKTSMVEVSEMAAKGAIKLAFGSLGLISSFTNVLGMLGMVLDAADVAGLNEEMTQAQIDATLQKMLYYVNSDKGLVNLGVTLPLKVLPETSFAFRKLQKETSGPANPDKFATDQADYISHLTVNSNGVAVIPTFQTPVQQQQQALAASAASDPLFVLAGRNLEVYSRLKSDWPFLLVGAVLILAAIVGGAFGIRAMARKNKR